MTLTLDKPIGEFMEQLANDPALPLDEESARAFSSPDIFSSCIQTTEVTGPIGFVDSHRQAV